MTSDQVIDLLRRVPEQLVVLNGLYREEQIRVVRGARQRCYGLGDVGFGS